MSSCFLLGIGGTGSRCIEASIHLAAAGLGPRNLWVGQVDPDSANGNLDRTQQLLENYLALQTVLRDDPKHSLHAEDSLFATHIESATPQFSWSPVRSAPNLYTLFQRSLMQGTEATMFDALFSPTHEQRMDLSVGFRGRPALGSAAMAAAARPDDVFWRNLLTARDRLRAGHPVRIFLVGSIFGGTGAGGLPTLARMLRRHLSDAGNQRKLHIGAALMLPYFTFPDEREETSQPAAKSAAFLEQTRGALRYYHHLTRTEPTLFDGLTVLGWPQLIKIDKYAIGRKDQSNPPLAPELLAALAAFRFFHSPPEEPGVGLLSVLPDKGLGWSNLPGMGVETKPTPKRALGQLARFAFLMRNVYGPQLGRTSFKQVQDQFWFRRMVQEAGVSPENDLDNRMLERLTRYSTEMLRWSTTIQTMSTKEQLPIRLFDLESITSKTLAPDGLYPITDSSIDLGTIFDGLVQDAEGQQSMSDVLEDLATGPARRDVKGWGRVIGAVHHACRFQPAGRDAADA